MPSFDTVSEVDLHEIRNAADQANREVGTRYDFKGSCAAVEHRDDEITLRADNEFQLEQVKNILHAKLAKRGVDLGSLEERKLEETINQARQTLSIRQGIPAETARKIAKLIKEAKMKKVHAAIQGDKVRISGKKRDDLQGAIALLREASIDLPLQFINFRD